MATTFSKSNTSKPAPKWWRKLENGLLMIVFPAITFMISSWGFKDELFATRLTLIISTGLVAMVKFIGLMLANGEEYTQTENPQP